MATPLLVVVTGPPASGKSTIAAELARRARLPLLAKDPIKEILFDTLGWSDRAWSRRLGVAVYGVLYEAAGELLGAGRSLILEANFDHERARRDLLALPPSRIVQVYCTAQPELLLARFDERARSGARHPAHGGMDDELAARIRGGDFGPLDLDGPRFDVVTERSDDISLAAVEAAIGSQHPRPRCVLPSAETVGARLRESFGADEASDRQVETAASRIRALLVESLG